MRVRITFSKTTHMRFTSHLDLHRTWERTLRRAKLPLAYSKGFNPRPKINLASALPLGFTSECEIIEFWLKEEVQLNQIEHRIISAAPPGIDINSIEEISLETPKIPNLVDSSIYMVRLLDQIPNLDEKVEKILSSKYLLRTRRGKQYDLRPLIESLEITFTSDDGQELIMQLAARTGATGRPEEALLALGIDPLATRVHRNSLLLKSN